VKGGLGRDYKQPKDPAALIFTAVRTSNLSFICIITSIVPNLPTRTAKRLMLYVQTIWLKPGRGLVKTLSKIGRVTGDVLWLTENKII
jgi:hypothetical protein